MDDCVSRNVRYFREEPKPGIAGAGDHRLESERDFGRVLHSGAFRRLQGKSQVVHTGHADYFRTRLTHTLEVSQIAKGLARRAGIKDSDLVETACLIHDIGHPPFGHNGETALAEWMVKRGGFEGNAQSFRVVASLEVKFPPSRMCGRLVGLNLSRETLRASFKYPWPRSVNQKKFGYYEGEEPDAQIAEWVLGGKQSTKTAVAVLMDYADDIAYSVHDLEDGARADLIPLDSLRRDRTERTALLEYWSSGTAPATYDAPGHQARLDWLLDDSKFFDWCDRRYTRSNEQRGHAKAMTSGLIDHFIRGVTFTRDPVEDPKDIHLSPDVELEWSVLKAMTWRYVIDSQNLQTLQFRERKLIREIADALFADATGRLLPEDKIPPGADDNRRARAVCDFVAGMTDRFATSFHARLFGTQSQSISDLM